MKNKNGLLRVSLFGIGFTLLTISNNITRTPLFLFIVGTTFIVFGYMFIKSLQNRE